MILFTFLITLLLVIAIVTIVFGFVVANKMLNGLTTDYAAYEVIQKYKKFVMTQFFK